MATGFIPQEILDEIASKCDIVSVIGEYVPLKRKGANYQGLCPFHNEKTPSFSVSPAKQIYHCFGCGAGGNIFKFIMEIEHLNFREAVEKLAKRANVSLPQKELSNAEKQAMARKKRFLQINEITAKYYQKVLLETKAGQVYRDYLSKRGLGQEVIEKFGLGSCQSGWDGLYRFLLQRQVSPLEMEQLGLVLPSKEGNRYYDRFRERIMFPIRNEQGQVVAFGGRIIDADVSPQKYMNSPDTPLFNKGKLLYGLDVAKSSIRAKDQAVIMEGYMDVISAHQYGVTNAVAPLGTAFTAEQAKLLMRNTYQIYIAFDGDTAGSKATWRSLDILNSLGAQAKVITLPKGVDPDEFLKINGKEAFEELIMQSQELIVYKIGRLMENNNTDEISGKMQIVKAILPDVLKMNSPIARESAVSIISQKLQLTENAIYSELKNANRNNQQDEQFKPMQKVSTRQEENKGLSLLNQEGHIIKILYENPELIEQAEVSGGALLFATEVREIYQTMAEILKTKGQFKSSDFSEAQAQLLASILMMDDVANDAQKVLADYIKHTKAERLDNEYKMRLQELADAEKTGDTDKMLKALQNLETLRAMKKETEIMGKGE